MRVQLVITLCVQWCALCRSLKILVIMPVFIRSHYFPFKAISQALADRGHQVTFITPFSPKAKIENLEYYTLEVGQAHLTELFSFKDVDGMHANAVFTEKITCVLGLAFLATISCNLLKSPELERFKLQNRSYDLVIGEAFHTNCFAPFAHHFDAPLVLLTASVPLPWYQPKFGQPANAAYVPSFMAGFAPKMSFWQRLQNVIIDAAHVLCYDYLQEPTNYKLAQEYFGADIPSFGAIIDKVSVLLTNSHFAYAGARPKVPGIIEIGGIHIGKSKPVPHKYFAYFYLQATDNS